MADGFDEGIKAHTQRDVKWLSVHRERDMPGAALEHSDAEIFLQRANLVTYRRWRYGELGGCLLETAMAGGRFECPQRRHGWKPTHRFSIDESTSSMGENSEFVEPRCEAHLVRCYTEV